MCYVLVPQSYTAIQKVLKAHIDLLFNQHTLQVTQSKHLSPEKDIQLFLLVFQIKQLA